MFVHVAAFVAGSTTTSWPGVAGVFASYPENVTSAWFAFVGSANTDEITRPGWVGVSRRVNVTLAAASFAFREISSRPAPVPAHSVPASRARAIAEMVLPLFVAPKDVPVSVAEPSGGQSAGEPHAPVKSRSLGNSPTAVLQCASRKARSPPAVDVRQTRCAPTKIVLVTSGSEIVGV